MTIIEAMESRISTRSFDGAGLTAPEAAELAAMLESVAGETAPFGNKVRLTLSGGAEVMGDGAKGDGAKPVRLGTYGLIAGASAFIVPAVLPGVGAMEDAGFIIEKAVLEATALGWASCWIGGVFSRSKAAKIAAATDGELIPAVIALGKPALKRSLADRIVTGAAKARSRKALADIVFAAEGLEKAWAEATQALRNAPSASNKQPWRLLRLAGRNEWLIFLDEDRVYNNSLGAVHIQNIDIGIGMRHFHEAATASGMKGRWIPLPVADDTIRPALRYGEEKGWIPVALWQFAPAEF